MSNLAVAPETMTSTQLGEILNYSVKETNKKIRVMFGEDKVGEIFSPTLRPNGQVLEYNLPEIESKMFVAKYDLTYLEKITRFWVDKGNTKLSLPKNFPEALRLAADQHELIEQQNELIEQKSQQIAAKDDLITVSNEGSIKAGEILVRQFCKSIDFIEVGEKKMFAWLKSEKYLNPLSEPYQFYIGRGYFTFKPTKSQHNGHYRYTTRITPRGKVWLGGRLLKYYEKNGAI